MQGDDYGYNATTRDDDGDYVSDTMGYD